MNGAETSLQSARDIRIALCLSGGGFRATLFHLGVIRFLRDTGLLTAVTDVFSVSGGSIVAGHLALRWADYSEPNTDRGFHEASTELIRLVLGDLRGRIIRRWILFGWFLDQFSRTRQLERYLSVLYRFAELDKLPENAPVFRFLSTSLATGDCCLFSRGGYTILPTDRKRCFFPASDLPLGRAVAASAAFPPLFPPLALDRDAVHAREKDMAYTDRLTDGGVFDNTGVWALKREIADGEMKAPTFVIVSDASAAFDWHVAPSYSGAVARNIRASDILMHRAAQLQQETFRIGDSPVCWLSIHSVVGSVQTNAALPFHPQHAADQAMLGFVRTDLDTFSLPEIRALVKHGYEVAWSFFADVRPAARLNGNEPTIWDPCPPGWPDYQKINIIAGIDALRSTLKQLGDVLDKWPSASAETNKDTFRGALVEAENLRSAHRELREAARRRIGVWNWGDWASYALVVPPVLGFIALLARFIWN